jgi:hypothetical protein
MRASGVAAIFAMLANALPAMAQTPGGAAELFKHGVAEMEAERYDRACPAIAESYRLEPLPGALFTLAVCEAKWGKIASAVAHYDDYLRVYAELSPEQQRSQRGRDELARQERDKLAPQVPRLEVAPPSDESLVVLLDGNELGRPSLGIPLPVDPGEHVITVRRSDGTLSKSKVVIASGESKTVTPPMPEASPPPREGSPRGRPKSETPKKASPEPRASGGHGALTYGLLVVGVTGVTGGLVFGGLSWRDKGTVDRECKNGLCSPDGKRAADRGQLFATISTVATGVGVVALGTGITLWISESGGQHGGRAVGFSKAW